MANETNIADNAAAIRAIAELGRDATGVTFHKITSPEDIDDGLPGEIEIGIKHGASPALLSLKDLFEEHRIRPARKSGTAKGLTLASFIDLAIRHKTENSVVFADTTWTKPSFTAVIDYHEAGVLGEPAFGKHRVHYAFPLSEEWQAWISQNGKPMSQGDFAAFIEDRIAELSSPLDPERAQIERDFGTTCATPAELIRLSRGLQVNVDAKVKRAINLQTGEAQIEFEETHKDADGKPIKVPGMFVLNVAPFFMGEKTRVPVRLRYRVSGDKISWYYQIYRPDQAITERVRSDLAIVASETSLPTYEGSPEMPG